jgi:hypothetical protein
LVIFIITKTLIEILHDIDNKSSNINQIILIYYGDVCGGRMLFYISIWQLSVQPLYFIPILAFGFTVTGVVFTLHRLAILQMWPTEVDFMLHIKFTFIDVLKLY